MTSNTSCFDYAVVGAGPAGSLAAWSLARRGRSVAVFDWRPRAEKPCGGGVPSRGMRWFGHLLDSVPRNEVRRIRLLGPLGDETIVPLLEPVAIFSRRELDGALREQAVRAGAHVISARVMGYQRTSSGFVVLARTQPTIEARFLVCADGATGPIRTQLLRDAGIHAPREPREFSRSFTTYPSHHPSQKACDTMEISYWPDTNGYAWTFPRNDHASIGVCMQDLKGEGRAIHEGVGWPIPSYREAYLRALPIEGDGFALVGDAAGAVDPITREGIHYAMQSGAAVGECDPLQHPGSYAQWFEREIRAELLRSARLAPRFFETRFLTRMIRLLQSSRALERVFQDLVAGRQPYSTLKRRLLLQVPSVLLSSLRTFMRPAACSSDPRSVRAGNP